MGSQTPEGIGGQSLFYRVLRRHKSFGRLAVALRRGAYRRNGDGLADADVALQRLQRAEVAYPFDCPVSPELPLWGITGQTPDIGVCASPARRLGFTLYP